LFFVDNNKFLKYRMAADAVFFILFRKIMAYGEVSLKTATETLRVF